MITVLLALQMQMILETLSTISVRMISSTSHSQDGNGTQNQELNSTWVMMEKETQLNTTKMVK
jgi:hypothetical protein